MEGPTPLSSFRERLQKATSEDEQVTITREILREYPNRYKLLREYHAEGNVDIQERLNFLRKEVVGDFIDIGSYDGFFVLELENNGHRAVGVDMMEEAIVLSEEEKTRYPQSRAEFIRASSDDLPFSNGAFDTVLLSHTLEHVLDPAKTLTEAIRIVKQGGKLIVIVPLELGNEPTHLRIVDPDWLEHKLKEYSTINRTQMVGDGIAFVCTVQK